mgnify:CR=1 FL=1
MIYVILIDSLFHPLCPHSLTRFSLPGSFLNSLGGGVDADVGRGQVAAAGRHVDDSPLVSGLHHLEREGEGREEGDVEIES